MSFATLPGTVRLYLRLSRTTEESTSIARQEADGRAHAERYWPGVPVVVYVDDGVSGAVPFNERPGGASLVAEWQRGDILLAAALDRVTRSLFGFADIVRDSEAAGVSLVTIRDRFDLSSAGGKLQASILAVVAEWERENVKTRVRNARRHLHKIGRWTGGRVPYGLKPAPHPSGVGKTLVRDEESAQIVKEIVNRVIDGEGPTTIAADLQKRGIPSPRMQNSGKAAPKAAAWSSRGVRVILESPTIVGYQIDPLTKRLVRDDEGLPVPVWEPIVDAEAQALALASLKPPTPRKAPSGRHWLYASARCGHCGGNLKRSNGGRNQPDVAVFRCAGPLKARHPLVSVRADALEDYVNDTVIRRLGGTQATEYVFVPGVDPTGELQQLRNFLTELEEDRAAGMFTTEESVQRYRQRYRDTAERIAQLEAVDVRAAGWQHKPTGERFAQRWQRWTDDERGDWLRTMGATVTVSRPEVKRARVSLAERCVINLGSVEDAADEMDALAEYV